MAEFLLLRKNTWMESYTLAEFKELNISQLEIDYNTMIQNSFESLLITYDNRHAIKLMTFFNYCRKNTLDQVKNNYRISQENMYLIREQKGDIIEIQENGYWGINGTHRFNKNVFVVVKISDAPLNNKYIKALYDITDSEKPIIKKKRAWRVLIDDVPPNIITRLADDGEVTLIWDNVKSFVRERFLNNGVVEERDG